MENKRIYLASPHMGGMEQEFVKEAFDTNWVAPLGPNIFFYFPFFTPPIHFIFINLQPIKSTVSLKLKTTLIKLYY